jgi:hypothetical protein
MKSLLSLVFVLLITSIAVPLWAEPIKITELAVTTKVSKGKPIDSVHRISHHTVKALYCFTRTASGDGKETTLQHVWMREGQVVKVSTLAIKGKNWRVYSTLPVNTASIGNWRVEVRDEAGIVMKNVEFRIQ